MPDALKNGARHVFSGGAGLLGGSDDQAVAVAGADDLPGFALHPMSPLDDAEFIGPLKGADHGPHGIAAGARDGLMAGIQALPAEEGRQRHEDGLLGRLEHPVVIEPYDVLAESRLEDIRGGDGGRDRAVSFWYAYRTHCTIQP